MQAIISVFGSRLSRTAFVICLFVSILSLLIITSLSYSQINLNVKASLSNTLRYGNGYEYISSQKKPKEYFENYADARLIVNEDFIFGARLEVSDPIEYGVNYKGLKKRYFEYKGMEMVQLRAGDFWDIVSRGMSLNLFEDRSIAYDTGIDGVRVIFKNTFGKKNPIKLKAMFIGGDLEYRDFIDTSRLETYKVRSLNIECSPLKGLTLGGNYVYSKGTVPSAGVVTNLSAEIPEGYLSFNIYDFQFYASYARKHIITDPNNAYPVSLSTNGDGFYSSVNFSKWSLGATFEYKNYRFDVTNPDYRNADRPTKILPFQNPPTAIKQSASTLVSRHPHSVDFNDEVGFEIDLVYVVNENLNLNLNGAIASKHYQYKDIDPTSKLLWGRINRNDSWLPSLKDEFSPYWELSFENEFYVSENFYYKIGASRQSSVLYNDYNPSASEKMFNTTIPTEFKYSFSKLFSLKFVFEQQWTHNSIRINQKDYTTQFLSLSFIRSPLITITLNSEFSSDDENPSGKKRWFSGELAFRINQSNTLMISYGSERGGFRCTNGICRFINPYEGFRFSVLSKF